MAELHGDNTARVTRGRTVGITELALRDAHQSLMATRMALEDMVGACADIDAAGYWSVEKLTSQPNCGKLCVIWLIESP